MKQVLITGGAGFIGSHLTEAILARGHRAIVLDDESAGSPENLHAVRDHFDFMYVKGSADDPELVRRLLRDVDDVYHLAAAVGVRRIADQPVDSIEGNIRPAQVLLAELNRCWQDGRAVRLFLASSSEVYGDNPEQRSKEEDELVLGPTCQCRWSYGAAKALEEFLALAYYRQHGLPVIVGRLFNVVGPRQIGRYGMVLPRFVDQVLSGKPPVVYDDGQQIRCFAHVVDVCQAILELVEAPQAVGQVFNIGSDEAVSILQLAERVVATAHAKLDIEFQSYRHAYAADFQDVRRRVPDLTRLHSTIGRRPQHSLDDIIQELIDWRRDWSG